MKRFLQIFIGSLTGLILYISILSVFVQLIHFESYFFGRIVSLIILLISIVLFISFRKYKHVVIPFLLTVFALSIIFSIYEIKKNKQDLKSKQINNNFKIAEQPLIETLSIDSTLLIKTYKTIDSIYRHFTSEFYVIREQLDGDCYSYDTFYYNQNNVIIRSDEKGGCSADEYQDNSLYFKNELLYCKVINSGDGLVNETKEIYFNNGEAFYGKSEKITWDYEKRIAIDTAFSILTSEELEKKSQLIHSGHKRNSDIFERIKSLKISSVNADKFVLHDTIQTYVENMKFIIDSTNYNEIIK